jgi:hypothetical protein
MLPVDQHAVGVECDALMGDKPIPTPHRFGKRTDRGARQRPIRRVRRQQLLRPRRSSAAPCSAPASPLALQGDSPVRSRRSIEPDTAVSQSGRNRATRVWSFNSRQILALPCHQFGGPGTRHGCRDPAVLQHELRRHLPGTREDRRERTGGRSPVHLPSGRGPPENSARPTAACTTTSARRDRTPSTPTRSRGASPSSSSAATATSCGAMNPMTRRNRSGPISTPSSTPDAVEYRISMVSVAANRRL